MRRKLGLLLPIQNAILRILYEADDSGPGLHGYGLAQALSDADGRDFFYGSEDLAANGTIYKALRRLLRRGSVSGAWEDPDLALERGSPRRKYYRLTELGRKQARSVDMRNRAYARLAGDPIPVVPPDVLARNRAALVAARRAGRDRLAAVLDD